MKIHCNVYVAQFTTIEDDVFMAPGVTIANDPHPICTKCMQGPTHPSRRAHRRQRDAAAADHHRRERAGRRRQRRHRRRPGRHAGRRQSGADLIGPVDSRRVPVRHRHPLRAGARRQAAAGVDDGRAAAASGRPAAENALVVDARPRRHLRLQRRREDPPDAGAPSRRALLRSAGARRWIDRRRAGRRGPGVIVLRNPINQGIGAAMKRVFQYALDTVTTCW